MSKILFSIVIPTYNRADFIVKTIQSILNQTYSNFEIIVVDDGSSDNTAQVVATYCKNEARFQYHQRPLNKPKGANACRNYGFELSKGEYVNWFDDDDLMVDNKIALKVDAILKNNTDFVISKTKFFNKKNHSFKNYDFKIEDVSFISFATDYIKWLTPDLFVKSNVVEKIKFNEKLKAGQEHNFNCNLLLHTSKMFFINEFLTLRRYSENSIQAIRDQDKTHNLRTIFHIHWFNYLSLKDKANNKKFNSYSLLNCALSYLELKNLLPMPKHFLREMFRVFHYKGIYFLLALCSNQIFKRYYFFYKYLKKE